MTVIELLNKRANGKEVPKKIKYRGTIYNFKDGLYHDERNEDETFKFAFTYLYLERCLNDEVEIIEEPQEHKIPEKFEIYDNSIEWCCNGRSITDNEKDIMDKINEILDYLEEIE